MAAMTPAAVTEFRGTLWQRGGFRPVALTDWNAPGPSPGKRPIGQGWQLDARLDPPKWSVTAAVAGALNTGILCDQLRSADFDIDDVAICRTCVGHALQIFGYPATYRYRDNSPRKLLPYRAAEGAPTKRSLVGKHGKIEMLGFGQQFCCDGIHDTGVEIKWSGEGLASIKVSDLPAITEEQITEFFALCAGPLGAAQPKANGSDDEPHVAGEPQAEIERVVEMLDGIPNGGPPDWEYWNKIGMAAFAATGGSTDGYRAWDTWSARNPAYDAEATRKRWNHYFRSPPSELGFGTLFHEWSEARRARLDGWIDPGPDTEGEADPWAKYAKTGGAGTASQPPPEAEPIDLSVLHLNRRPPPEFPLEVLGEEWQAWIVLAAHAANVPVDYVAAPLLAVASALIGNARWVQGWDGWDEPPILWIAAIGDSGDGKSPGGDTLFGKVLPELERRMVGDFPDRKRDWLTTVEVMKAREAAWQSAVKDAEKQGNKPPPRPTDLEPGPEPQFPRLKQTDVTIEKVAQLLAESSPKGLLLVRDELAGFLGGMSVYNDAARPFWLESYGGRSYRVERKTSPEPIVVAHNTVALFGTIQPSRWNEVLEMPDDGLVARTIPAWPEPVDFTAPDRAPDTAFAIAALDRLRALEMYKANGELHPIVVPLVRSARPHLVAFGRRMQREKLETEGLMRSAYGKARGLALRLSLVLEFLRWCGSDPNPFASGPPAVVSEHSFNCACRIVADYHVPMCFRAYGDSWAPEAERHAALLARWIVRTRPGEVHVRRMYRTVRLPALNTAEKIHKACAVLVEARWLLPGARAHGNARARASYPVNPVLWEVWHENACHVAT